MNRPRVLYVDAIAAPHARSSMNGILSAYREVTEIATFDYRESARRHGPKVPWSRPEIWPEDEWQPLVSEALSQMNWELVAVANWFRPDLVHLGKCELVTGEAVTAVKETGAFVAHFYGDLSREVKPWVADIGKAADITLLYHKDPGLMRAHVEAGCRKVGFWWAGTDPEVFRPRAAPAQDFDVIFMGKLIQEGGQERECLLRRLAGEGLNVHVFGGNWSVLDGAENVTQHPFVDEDEFAWVCSRAKVALSENASDVAMYCSWRRVFNSMACGTFVLVRYFPGLETVFDDGVHLAWFRSTQEAVELAQRYLRDEDARARVAARGRREVLRAHTWARRVDEMLRFWRPKWTRPTS